MKQRTFLIVVCFLIAVITPPLGGQSPSPAKGRWLNFPGDSEAFLEVEDNPSLNLRSQITIEAWIYPRSLPPLPQARWQLVQKGRAYNFAIIRTAIPGQVLLEMNRIPVIIQDELKIGAWNHIGGSYNGNTGQVRLYLNGKSRLIEGVEKKELESPSALQVGQQFDGGMDALRISRNVRYKDDYEPPRKHFEADRDTVLLWHFEDDKDSSKNENKFEVQGEGLRFVGTPFLPVARVGNLAVMWSQIKNLSRY